MTVLLPCGRALSKQLLPRSGHLLTRLASTKPILRVSSANGRDATSDQSQTGSASVALPIRTYATAARAASKPKAHTGRTTAKRTTKTTTKKPTAKKAAPKKAVKKPKPRKKAVKAKAAPKRKVLSANQQARHEASERTELKRKAMLAGGPKKLPDTAWTVCFVEHAPKKGKTGPVDGTHAKTASQAYKNMTPEEHERMNRIANENKAKNEAALKRWVQSFTPLQIKEANTARDQLKREAKKNGRTTRRFSHIKDDRLVKQPPNTYAMFLQDRYASGDMNGMKVGEIGKLVAREFKEMSPAQKKTYEDKFAAERNRYFEEFKTVYGVDSPASKRPLMAAAA